MGAGFWENTLYMVSIFASGICNLTDGSSAGDWRIPHRYELESLLNMKYFNPALSNTSGTGNWTDGDPFIFFQPTVIRFWTSTTHPWDWTSAWYVDMLYGQVDFIAKNTSLHFWPVRGGH